MPPRIDEVVNGKYRIVRQLGEGGMGSVFEAIHEGLRSRVALKFLHHELAGREEALNRFMQEARVVASIKSLHVVQVNDVEKNGAGELFMVLEYLEGQTLQRLYEGLRRDDQRLGQADALLLAAQMLDGTDAAHRMGIVHRDLKPDNVMIVEGPHGEPFVKLLDFGIAKLRVAGQSIEPGMTRPGVVMGTAEYMAPEQAFSADAVDARADVFALGVMFYEMFAGRRPAAGDEPRVLAAAHLAGNIPRLADLAPDLPPGLADVVHRAMAAKPSDRYASAGELLQAIEPFASEALSALATTAYAVSRPKGSAPGGPLGTALLPAAKGTTVMPAASRPPASREPSSREPAPRQPANTDAVPTTRPAQVVKFDSPPAVTPEGGVPGDMTMPWATGEGYAPLDRRTPTADEPGGSQIPAPPPHARSLRVPLWVWFAAGGFALVLAIVIGVILSRPHRTTDDDDRPPKRPAHTTQPRRPPKKR